MATIPVLGVPILSRPELLDAMLASIDVEVGQLVIVDNGGVVFDRPGAHVIRPGHNLGVAASWNLVVKSAPRADWWMLASFDLVFAPGDLERLASHMSSVGGVALLGTFAAFGLDRDAVRRAGTFDENFVPAYFEDNDFDYRCRLTGVPMAGLPAGLSHRISSTIGSSSVFSERNSKTFPSNREYFVRKWGGPPTEETYTSPFNRGGDPREWRLDIDRLREQSWT